jgi:glycosyltransferase involved in cell wall biosynthesis
MGVQVSVIIPCYNCEAYIAECIDSVINQSYTNIEIICIDNNSKDNTFGVLERINKQENNRITIIKELKPGASIARNTGLSIAKGEWIQFLDADDILMKDKISEQVKLISYNEIELIVGNYSEEVDNKRKQIVSSKDSWEGLIIGRLGYTSSNLWKRESIMNVGGWDDIKSSQEAYLMFKLLKKNAKIMYDERFNTLKIERNKNSISKTNVKDNIIRYIELRILIWEYLKTASIINTHLLKVLKINVFDSIRILYSENNEAGVELYNKHVKQNFKPIVSQSTSILYLMLYKLVGFKMAQKIRG